MKFYQSTEFEKELEKEGNYVISPKDYMLGL